MEKQLEWCHKRCQQIAEQYYIDSSYELFNNLCDEGCDDDKCQLEHIDFFDPEHHRGI